MLVCVAIVSILTAISLSSYSGSLDQAELKFVTPNLTKELESLRKAARADGTVITVDFQLGTANYIVKRRKGTEETVTPMILGGGILKRKITYLRFEDDGGDKASATVTFLPDGRVQGGKVYLGTSRAEHNIRIINGAIVPSFIP
jgi:Tfp pilus assembly protein FimT